MTNQIIQNLVTGIVRRKLEDILLGVMDDVNNLPANFFESKEIARQQGLTDLVQGFDEVLREVGEIQARRAIERAKTRDIKQEEAKYEQYLISHPEALDKVESGLKFKASQKRVKSGRLDILAEDKEGKQVRHELKARDYDPKRTAIQLLAYLNETDERVIFDAPSINPQLVFALRAYQETGKIKFIERQGTEGNYTYREVKPEDIPEPEAIQWKSRKTNGNSSLVRVTSHAPKTRKGRKFETDEFEAGEEIPQGSFDDRDLEEAVKNWEAYPEYYKVLMVARPNLRDKKTYLQPIEVSTEQMKGLESLVKENETRKLADRMRHLTDLKENAESTIAVADKIIEKELKEHERKIIGAALDKINCYVSVLNKLREEGALMMLGVARFATPEQAGVLMEEAKKYLVALNKVYVSARYQDKEIQKARNIWNKFKSKIKDPKTREIILKRVERIQAIYGFVTEQCEYEAHSLRTQRAERLMEIDQNLAMSYFGYSFVHSSIPFRKMNGEQFPSDFKVGDCEYIVSAREFTGFLEADNELYRNILTQALKVRQEAGSLEVKAETAPIIVQPAQRPQESEKAQQQVSPYETLRQTIMNNHPAVFSEDTKARINYLAGDLEARGYNSQALQNLSQAFSKLHLAKRLRNRESRPSDLQLRNFFDDIYLGILQGKEFSADELERAYEGVKNDI